MLVDPRYLGTRLPGYLELDVENNNLLEKARAQLMWDRLAALASPGGPGSGGGTNHSPSGLMSPSIHPQLYSFASSRGNHSPSPIPALPAQLWSQWTALHGLTNQGSSLTNPASLGNPHMTPPPHTSSSQLSPALVAAAASTSSAAAAAAVSLTRPLFPTPLNLHRYSPYFLPKSSQDSEHQS